MKSYYRRALIWTAGAAIAAQLASTGARAETKASARKAGTNGATAVAPEANIGDDWVRMHYDADGDVVGMQTAIVRYAARAGGAGAAPVQVDLIGAVHIADAAYYKQLNKRFKEYDALLYELVAPEGTVVERGRGSSSGHPIGAMQNMAKDVLELDHQLEEIDYTRPNFVHADMSPDDFNKAMRDRNDSFLQMYFRLIGQAMAQQSELQKNGPSDFELITALFASDRPRRLKIILGKQLSEMESLMVSFGGEDGSVIITDRNKKALEVLKRELAKGRTKIGIFYGAGHLGDMDKRLRKDFGLAPQSVTWLTAWNLAPKQ